jgi:adenylate cyclase
MPTEVERKFLVTGDGWRRQARPGTPFRQGYLNTPGRSSVRVRIEGERANLNIKSAVPGIRRREYEYPIPLHDAQELLDELCEGPIIEKVRYHVPHAGHTWEVDVFGGANEGLVVAELELEHEEEPFERPDWLGEEVSHDQRYYNVSLVKHPYSQW